MPAGWTATTVVASAGLQLWWARTAGRSVERGQRRIVATVGSLGPIVVGWIAFAVWLVQAWPAS